MELEEYRQQFIDQLRFDAEHEESDPGALFLTKTLEQLEDIGELNDPSPVSIEMKGSRGRILAFDAYAYDEADAALVLIISDFSNERDQAPTLTNTRIADHCNHMRNFIDEAVNGHVENYCDDSDEAIILAKEFKKNIGKNLTETQIMRFKFYILTDAKLSQQVKSVKQEDFLERPVELNVWTIERFYNAEASNSSEILEIETSDFGCDGIPFIQANLGDEKSYDAYMGIVPGEFLAQLYLKYGSKLLQGNIRAFLSVRGKVNRGIRDTIANEPDDFFIFNNGIAIVARSVEFSADGSKIVHLMDPQIINGGQTTASLANAIIRKEAKKGMQTIFVPMKLTVLNVEDDLTEEQLDKYNEMTKRISQCANSQNAVSEADFFSNHPYHVIMEKLSRQVMAPPVDGQPFQTTWFYERSRGKWEQEQMKLTVAERKKFGDKHPKNQVVKKEKLAKCLNALLGNPHEVCQSSATNFSKFAKEIEDMYTNRRDSINEEYFKRSICAVILFDKLDSLINKASWYPKGGDKAQIVPYALAKFMSLLPKDKTLDWKTIWQKQNLYQALAAELLRLAKFTMDFLKDKAAGGLVRTLARREETWKDFKKASFTLSDDLLKTLWSADESKAEVAAATRAHKFNSDIDASVDIFNLGADYWMQVYNDLNRQDLLPYGDLNFIKSIASYIAKMNLPTTAQCKRLVRIVTKAEDKGFMMP